jgi:hypothetical protein
MTRWRAKSTASASPHRAPTLPSSCRPSGGLVARADAALGYARRSASACPAHRHAQRPPAQLQRAGPEWPPGGADAAASAAAPLAIGNDCQCCPVWRRAARPTMPQHVRRHHRHRRRRRLLRQRPAAARLQRHGRRMGPLEPARRLLRSTACRLRLPVRQRAAWSAMCPARHEPVAPPSRRRRRERAIAAIVGRATGRASPARWTCISTCWATPWPALVLALDPHAIVLGGGLSQMAHLYEQAAGRREAPPVPGVHVPPILPPASAMPVARGAALLATAKSVTHEETLTMSPSSRSCRPPPRRSAGLYSVCCSHPVLRAAMRWRTTTPCCWSRPPRIRSTSSAATPA